MDVADCYAACRVDDHTLAFSPYTGFPLVRANARKRLHEAVALPRRLHGSSALSVRGDATYLFGPYEDKRTLFAFRRGQPPRELGRHSGPLRGLEFGRFLSIGQHGFTVLDVDDAA